MLPIVITGLMPPHPDFIDDQDDPAHHRLLHDTNTDQPRHQTSLLHPAACKHLSESECTSADSGMIEQASSVRNLIQSSENINCLVLLVRFQDHVNRALPSREDISTLLNGDGSTEPNSTNPIIPTGSVSDWLRLNSYGNLNINMDVMPWITTDNTESHYANGESGLFADYAGSFGAVLEQLDDGSMDWSKYDLDNDGKIDSLIVLHSGFAAEQGNIDCYSGSNANNRIWSHAIYWIRPNLWRSKDDSITVGTYITSSSMRARCGSKIARIGVIAHELVHTWGAPDLYDNNGWIGKGTGLYDVMSNPYGRFGTSINPAFLSPWSKMQLGWLDPLVLTKDGHYFLGASELYPQVYKIQKGFPDGEYLLIENRQPIRWDEDLWSGGVLIWHIDENAPLQRYRGYPDMDGWPGNNDHYQVALLQADGKYDLEMGTNIGDQEDFFVTGYELNQGPGVDEASDSKLYPNSDSYQYPNIKSTGIRIFDFSQTAEFMTFQITGLSPTKPPTASPTYPPTLTRKPTESPTASPTLSPTVPPTSMPVFTPIFSLTEPPTLAPPTLVSTVPRTPLTSGDVINSDLSTAFSIRACWSLVLGATAGFFIVDALGVF